MDGTTVDLRRQSLLRAMPESDRALFSPLLGPVASADGLFVLGRLAQSLDGFIALPGGLGTMEELMEVLTWAQLGWHGKPIALLDVGGFYGLLDQFLHHLVTEGFVAERDRRMLLNGSSPDEVLALMRAYVPPSVPSYLERSDL